MASPRPETKLSEAEVLFKKIANAFLAIERIPEQTILKTLDSASKYPEFDVNRPIKQNGSVMLHTAVWFKKLGIIKWLLEHKANPNHVNQTGNTPMHFAGENVKQPDMDKVLALLVQFGGDVSIKDAQGKSTLEKAKNAGVNIVPIIQPARQAYLKQQKLAERKRQMSLAAAASSTSHSSSSSSLSSLTSNTLSSSSSSLSSSSSTSTALSSNVSASIPSATSTPSSSISISGSLPSSSLPSTVSSSSSFSVPQRSLPPPTLASSASVPVTLAPTSSSSSSSATATATKPVVRDLKQAVKFLNLRLLRLFSKLPTQTQKIEDDILKDLGGAPDEVIKNPDFNLNQQIADQQHKPTFLHLAVKLLRPALVRALLEKGANPNSTTSRGETPLHYVVEQVEKENARDIVTILVQHRADLTLKDWGKSKSPLELLPNDELRKWASALAATAAAAASTASTLANNTSALPLSNASASSLSLSSAAASTNANSMNGPLLPSSSSSTVSVYPLTSASLPLSATPSSTSSNALTSSTNAPSLDSNKTAATASNIMLTELKN
eukprot:TRINITY_DN1340_c0_g1_i1.p1 TRINITY_DN1340_c0_g1~~TRINITY_DN1340_c0_g1_i1.p1  ORF type:complete len:553 (-),score=229.39 TRINITY_DN1340_c0_g1_i1:874-2532(-)